MTDLDSVRGGNVDGYAFDVFLSHAREDAGFAREMANWLRQCGHSVWLDEEQLVPGSRFRAGLQQGLRESRHMVALLTVRYSQRPWTRRELDLFDIDADHEDRRLLALQIGPVGNTLLDQVLLVSQRIPWEEGSLDPEGLWKLHCGLTGQRPGPHSDWATNGRRLLDSRAGDAAYRVKAPSVSPDRSDPGHAGREIARTRNLLSIDSEFAALRDLAGQVLTRDAAKWRAPFTVLREQIARSFAGVAAYELITLPWATGLAEVTSIATLAFVANGVQINARGSTWSFIDLSCEAIANRLLLGGQLVRSHEPSEVWFSWAVWQQDWDLLPAAAARAPARIRDHLALLAVPAATAARSFKEVEADYDYGVMITPWNHFHLGWLAHRLGDTPASISHLGSLCSATVHGDPRTGRFLNRLSTWPLFAEHRRAKDFREKIDSARSALGLVPLDQLAGIQNRIGEVWREVRGGDRG